MRVGFWRWGRRRNKHRHRLMHWIHSRLYYKLVLSHAVFLILFVFMAGTFGHYALRSFAQVMFHEQFKRQSHLLFGYLQSALRHSNKRGGRLEQKKAQKKPKNKRLPTSRKSSQSKQNSSVVYFGSHQRPLKPVPFSWKNAEPIIEEHVISSSQFLITLVSILGPDGRCILEAYPPALLNLMIKGKRLKRKGWQRLIRAPRIVLKRSIHGICSGMEKLQNIRHGELSTVLSREFRVGGVTQFVVRYHSLSPFRGRPPTKAFLISLVFIFGLSMILVFPINRSITRPLQRLIEAVKRIQAGELSTEVCISGHDEVGQLALAVEDMRSSLQSYQTQRRALLSDISHEIRTPLSRVRVVAESVADGLMRETERLTQAMEGICQQVDDIDQLMGDLLDIARFELSTTNQLERTTFSIHHLLREMHHSLLSSAEVEQVQLTLGALPSEELKIKADRRRLRQVINNLIQNAIRHSPLSGEVCLEAFFVEREEEGEILQEFLFQVCDEGPGIPIAERERIFERLVRLDLSRNRGTGGQGLGLSIVRQIVEAHEGSVGVEEAPSGGACFWVRLPVGL